MDDFEEKSRAFMAWLSQISVHTSSKITLADLRSQRAGRGVIASESITEDEILFTIPRSSILGARNSSLSTKLPQGMLDELDPWTSLILVMMYEFLQESNSSWKQYFDILPTTFDTLMFWTEEELAHLQASTVTSKIGKESANKTFRDNIIPTVRGNWQVFCPRNATLTDEDLLDLAHRMGSTIMAYAFDIEKSEGEKDVDEEGYALEEEDEALPKGMVPLADMLNADADKNNARLFYEEDALVMKAICPIPAGEEIFNDYGPLPRSDLLRRYGYITTNYAKYDVVEIPHDLVVASFKDECPISDTDIETRIAYLEGEDIVDTGYDITKQIVGEPIQESFSPELIMIVTALLLPEQEFKRMQERGKLPKLGPMPSKVATILSKAVRNRASEYGSTLEEDEQLLASLAKTPEPDTALDRRRFAMALRVRLGEKVVLREAEEALLRLHSTALESESAEKRRLSQDLGAPNKRRKGH